MNYWTCKKEFTEKLSQMHVERSMAVMAAVTVTRDSAKQLVYLITLHPLNTCAALALCTHSSDEEPEFGKISHLVLDHVLGKAAWLHVYIFSFFYFVNSTWSTNHPISVGYRVAITVIYLEKGQWYKCYFSYCCSCRFKRIDVILECVLPCCLSRDSGLA